MMRKLTESEWQELITDYNESGQSQTLWCGEKGINLYTFRNRLRKLQKTKSESEATVPATSDKSIRWLPVVREVGEKAGRIKISAGCFEMEILEGFDGALFREVCRELMTLC